MKSPGSSGGQGLNLRSSEQSAPSAFKFSPVPPRYEQGSAAGDFKRPGAPPCLRVSVVAFGQHRSRAELHSKKIPQSALFSQIERGLARTPAEFTHVQPRMTSVIPPKPAIFRPLILLSLWSTTTILLHGRCSC